MSWPKEVLEQVKVGASLGYTVDRICLLIEVDDEAGLRADFADPASEVARAMEKGKAQGQYLVDRALMEAARKGDMAAIKELRQLQHERALDPTKR
jgi:hypothetical protein